jgi:hypothetical protein
MIARRVAAAALAFAVAVGAAALPQPAAAVVIVYTLTVLPVTAVADVVTEFTVTVTNVVGPDELGCLELTLPATYELHSVSDPVQSAGRNWTAVAEGGTVVAHANGGGGRLAILQSVTFTVVARPKEAEISDWTHHAHRSHNCDDEEEIGIPVPVTVLPPILPSLPPSATPKPTPPPTPRPTPIPTPRPTAVPTPVVVVPPPATPSPSPTERPTPTPEASSTPLPSAAARPDLVPPGVGSDGGGTDPGSGDPTGSGAGPAGVQVAYGDEGSGPGPISLAAFASFTGSAVFAVPAAVLGGPGLLILLWVVLQVLGTATWIPAVRRLRGRDSEAA